MRGLPANTGYRRAQVKIGEPAVKAIRETDHLKITIISRPARGLAVLEPCLKHGMFGSFADEPIAGPKGGGDQYQSDEFAQDSESLLSLLVAVYTA